MVYTVYRTHVLDFCTLKVVGFGVSGLIHPILLAQTPTPPMKEVCQDPTRIHMCPAPHVVLFSREKRQCEGQAREWLI